MKIVGKILSLSVLIGLLCGSVSAVAQDSLDSASQAEVMAAQMAAAQPGPEHELLASLAGQWDLVVRYWSVPDAEPEIMSGTAENKMILGNRFLESAAVADLAGTKSESLTILGFDRRYGKFTSVSLDTWGTYWVGADGIQDPQTGVITFHAEEEDPIAGYTQKFDQVYQIQGDSMIVMSLIFKNPELTYGQSEFKMLEMVYTRKK